jgi:hypothetical protein
VPALLVVLAFTKVRGYAATFLVGTAILLFVVLFFVSYMLFCNACS